MRNLILYFKQYQVRQNFQEMKNSFYTTNSQQKAFMKQYQSYRQEQERYEDDMEEILDECEVYREIEERERMENYDDIEAQTKEQKKILK